MKSRISPKSAKPSALWSRRFSRPAKPTKPAVFGIGESIKRKFRFFQAYRFQNWYQSNTSNRSNFYIHVSLPLKIMAILKSRYGGFDREIKVWINFSPNFEITTVKTLRNSNSLNLHYFELKTSMNVKILLFTKLHTQNKISASKMRKFKQYKTSAFTFLILRRLASVQTQLVSF